ncbi:pyridoxal phosphate-dependent decarboxylase family protein [Haliscomenobacter hydrossis]|uniref:Sphinganine-1-phosphate aldolase n=1 Tax=Haliscomenobacter hydrossis (strain ATCC 27775 / DSM 1100 / LMG 10767 / O) TaxID=760192 RepID=F4KUV2_HALH1|nr:aspartate aminotransferase family protein [Haliscomenobacter hydrossis]AEE48128.1 Sphinganine-1-phosphate aldolase [Haliscomenobacter hydrossis DSM 1100]
MSERISIPARGRNKDTILDELYKLHLNDVSWKEGRAWSMVYYVDQEHQQLLEQAYNSFFSENYLNPFAFQSLKKMELEVIQMTAGLLNGDENVTGTMTSGGTESIFLAVYTYRERARQLFPHIKQPEIVVSTTIHPAFEKAAHILNIVVKKAAVDQNLCAQPQALEKLISPNTILIAASAPTYPHGVLDPITEIASLAQARKIPFHVDCCIGGFMLPWVEKLGYPVAPFDFRVPGVTSISADVHKFGYGAKGASVLLYRNMNYLKHQFYVATDWPGGIYASPTLLGSRPGGAIAATWSAMQALGQDGYLRITQEIMLATSQIRKALEDIPEIIILGNPVMNILAYSTRDNQPDIFVIADQLEQKGWMLDRQQLPNSIHLTVMRQNISVIDQYLEDLKASIIFAKEHPAATAKGNAALYGLMARIPFRGMVEKNVRKIFEELYDFSKTAPLQDEETPSTLPPAPIWMGQLNRVLTAVVRVKGFWKKRR